MKAKALSILFISAMLTGCVNTTTNSSDIEASTTSMQEITTSSIQNTTEEATTVPILETLYDNNNFFIQYKGITQDKDCIKIDLFIENKTDKGMYVQVRDFAINDFMVDRIFSPKIAAGKKTNDSIKVYNSELEKNGITQIEDIDLVFHFFESETTNDFSDSEPVHIEVK